MKDLLSKINWTDICFDRLSILNDDNIIIELSNDEFDESYTIMCINYIGFESIGHWDENVLSDISILNNTELITNCLKRIKENYNNTNIPGNSRKIDSAWYEIRFLFIDNSYLSIVCNNIEINGK